MRMRKVLSSEQTNHPFYSLNEKKKKKKKRSYETFQVATPLKHFILARRLFRLSLSSDGFFFLFYFFSLLTSGCGWWWEVCVCVLALGFVIGRVCYSGAARACRQPTWVAERTALEKTIWCLGGLEEKRKEGTQSHDVYTSTLVWLVFSFFFFFLFLFL
jgi:hypothetical protein